MQVVLNLPAQVCTETFSTGEPTWPLHDMGDSPAPDYTGPYWSAQPDQSQFITRSGYSGFGYSRPSGASANGAITAYYQVPAATVKYNAGWTGETFWTSLGYDVAFEMTWEEALAAFNMTESEILSQLNVNVPLGQAGFGGWTTFARRPRRIFWRMRRDDSDYNPTRGRSNAAAYARTTTETNEGGYFYPLADQAWHSYELEIVSGAVVFRFDGVEQSPNDGVVGHVDFGSLPKTAMALPSFFMTGDMTVDDVVMEFDSYSHTYEQQIVVSGNNGGPSEPPVQYPYLLKWNVANASERPYEYGVDRGVLFPNDGPGVAWPGLINVTEIYDGGDVRPSYVDGIKRHVGIGSREFRGAITAMGAPKEFNPCQGMKQIVAGLWVTRQRRETFGFSYRTRIGSGEHYKLHIVYNATATKDSSNHATLTDDVQPEALSWSITAVPPVVQGYKPTPHYVFDTRKFSLAALIQLESILYGYDSSEPRLPTIEEILELSDSLDGGDPVSHGAGSISGGGPSVTDTITIDGGGVT